MKNSKSLGGMGSEDTGLSGITANCNAYQRGVRLFTNGHFMLLLSTWLTC